MVGSYLNITKCKTTYSKLKFTILGNESIISKAKITTLLQMHSQHPCSQVACFVIPHGSHQLPRASAP